MSRNHMRIDGQQIYLGEYGSPYSFDKYNDLVSEWMTANAEGIERYKMPVDELALLYLKFAEGYYRTNGKPTSEYACIKYALKPLIAEAGNKREGLRADTNPICQGCAYSSQTMTVWRIS